MNISIWSYLLSVVLIGLSPLAQAQDANADIDAMMIARPGPYVIVEDTRNEVVAEGSDGRIVRWARTGGTEQQWQLIKNAAGNYSLRNVRSGRTIGIAWNGTYWAGADAATFNFARSGTAGRYRLVENTRGEYFSVGDNGWLVRWGLTGTPGQGFSFEPVNTAAASTTPTTPPTPSPAPSPGTTPGSSTTTPVASTATVTAAEMVAAINAKRQTPQNCGGTTYPAAPPLRLSEALTTAVQAMANAGAHSSTALSYVGAAGYLSWGASSVSTFDVIDANSKPAAPHVLDMRDPFVPTITLKAAPTAWMASPDTCRVIMTAYSDVGMAVKGMNLRLVFAEPYVANDRAAYVSRMFAELNRIRRGGINATLYPGAKCTSAAVAPLQWNDKFAAAAQFHSDDFASRGVVTGADGTPHGGTAGDTPQSRIVAQGCPNAGSGENVIFNGFLTPEQAVRGWIGLSAGHCGNLVRSDATVAGFGVAASSRLNSSSFGPVGPFVTYTVGNPGSCASASRAAP